MKTRVWIFVFTITLVNGDSREEFWYSASNRDYVTQPSVSSEELNRYRISGIYIVYPRLWMRKKKIEVYCDMETDGGGWTVFQRRDHFGQNFTRSWTDYANGFGNLLEEFWLGNDNIHVLSSQEYTTLRIDLNDFDGNTRHAQYDGFEVSDMTDKYRLTVGNYSGIAGEGLYKYSQNKTFVTWDKNEIKDCANKFRGGWWYSDCSSGNLNGQYLEGKQGKNGDGIHWTPWLGNNYSLKKTEMKIRPKFFTPLF